MLVYDREHLVLLMAVRNGKEYAIDQSTYLLFTALLENVRIEEGLWPARFCEEIRQWVFGDLCLRKVCSEIQSECPRDRQKENCHCLFHFKLLEI